MNIALKNLIETNWKSLSSEQVEKLLLYFDLIEAESKIQNLTRLEDAVDFYWGHLNDVRELVENFELTGRVFDLGSGQGVPGIPLSIVNPNLKLVLGESEVRKAEFLAETVERLGLIDRIRVFHGRGEEFLKANKVDFIVSRAVGTLSKHLNILGACSTWNTLILFKGPRWKQEWDEVQGQGKWKGKITVLCDYPYSEPHKNRSLRIVSILRGIPHVLRGA